ncbi:hypothetical protein SAMN05421858_5005 [Haladaptatus litoreus]|uniref:Uncharacterized protein n=1 Tax=Haladaptatus litoreus TaxID=553468 RepID=A0A1N7FEE5_9EURY|nr:hypothetical protein SAMN05421858_5005 [Haladaptatus litoreus]
MLSVFTALLDKKLDMAGTVVDVKIPMEITGIEATDIWLRLTRQQIQLTQQTSHLATQLVTTRETHTSCH